MSKQENPMRHCKCGIAWPTMFCPHCGGLANGTVKMAAQPTDTERQLIEQVTMVRNFPGHTGDYDEDLPRRKCPRNESIFRLGWQMAVSAINDRLTALQDEQRRPRDGEAAEWGGFAGEPPTVSGDGNGKGKLNGKTGI